MTWLAAHSWIVPLVVTGAMVVLAIFVLATSNPSGGGDAMGRAMGTGYALFFAVFVAAVAWIVWLIVIVIRALIA